MQMGSSKPPGSMPSSAVGPYGVSVPYMPPQATSATGSSHSDRLYGGSAFSHAGSGSMGNSSLNEKSSPRSSRGSLGDAGSYGLSVPSPRGSIQLPAPSVSQSSQPTQLGGSGSAHQAAVSLSHIAGGGGHQSQSQAASQPQTAAPGRTAASMNPKGTLPSHSCPFLFLLVLLYFSSSCTSTTIVVVGKYFPQPPNRAIEGKIGKSIRFHLSFHQRLPSRPFCSGRRGLVWARGGKKWCFVTRASRSSL
jgi:hypothetical protein